MVTLLFLIHLSSDFVFDVWCNSDCFPIKRKHNNHQNTTMGFFCSEKSVGASHLNFQITMVGLKLFDLEVI